MFFSGQMKNKPFVLYTIYFKWINWTPWERPTFAILNVLTNHLHCMFRGCYWIKEIRSSGIITGNCGLSNLGSRLKFLPNPFTTTLRPKCAFYRQVPGHRWVCLFMSSVSLHRARVGLDKKRSLISSPSGRLDEWLNQRGLLWRFFFVCKPVRGGTVVLRFVWNLYA